ncbi:heavy metal translocatin [Athelia psychrophila]|uniref:Heavy metal translocatin n=1 Tax=Athelia psychrophila TaxID=1759441 RepID=A0A166FYB3_9AGAM|nr:heavy metal translocatin [Fibularhizoctonia sp. CBS 109695]
MPPDAAADEQTLTTTLLVSNLHCSSCVHAIQLALSALAPPPTNIHTSIVSQTVTVDHPHKLPAELLYEALEDAGFDVVPRTPVQHDDTGSSIAAHLRTRQQKTHLEQCALCREEDNASPSSEPTASRDNVGTEVEPAVSEKETGEFSDSKAYSPARIDEIEDGPLRLTLSIGGMTCGACASTITHMVTGMAGVSEVAVSLLSKSATVIISQKKTVEAVCETIEDCGFEAEVITCTPVADQDNADAGPRVVSLRVDGMFCQHCPPKVMEAVRSLGPDVTIVKQITSYTDPILEVSYQPHTPTLTVRTIIATIASSKDPPFDVFIYTPPSLEDRTRMMQQREQTALLRRLALAVLIAIPTFIIGIVFMSLVGDPNPTKAYLMQPMWAGNVARSQWALFFLATPVQFYSAGMFHRRSLKELRALWRPGSTTPVLQRFIRFGSMNLLVSTGVSVAYFSSIALLALAAEQPASATGVGNSTTYFDSVVFLTMFLLAGRFLEAYSKARTADAITALGSLRPAQALLIIAAKEKGDDSECASSEDVEKGDTELDGGALSVKPGFQVEKIDASLLEVGDIVRIPHGATPPADATIVSAEDTAFDESSLTGESRLIKKSLGDKVLLGTINKGKMVDARVDAHGGATMLDNIIKTVREGQTRRAPIERIADLVTGYFVPVICLLAIVTWMTWLGLGLSGALPRDYLDIPIGGWTIWSLEFGIAVMVIACPCGIGLAAPTALLVGSGLAAKYGILARGGGEAFQEMAQVDIIVFDKTGTLTQGGDPRVSDSNILTGRWQREVILGMAAELESTSSHPLGTAITSFCQAEAAPSASGSNFEEMAGKGLKAQFEELHCTAIIGNESWMEDHGVAIEGSLSEQLENWKSQAKSVVVMAVRDETDAGSAFQPMAIFAISDAVRPEARSVVSRLQENGIGTWMISGDNVKTAEAVALSVGISKHNVIAGVLPHEKAEKIQWLQRAGIKRKTLNWRNMSGAKRLNSRCIVAMVGDGINDAPALTAADVGIAIGSGSDVAISSASFILLSSNLQSLLTLSDLSRTVFNRVKLNFFWAAIYNCIALPVAAGVIYPAGHVRLNPVWASLAMALSSVSVVCSSLLLKLYRQPKVNLT